MLWYYLHFLYMLLDTHHHPKIINNFMPGPITIILKKKKSNICKLITASNDTIGIRTVSYTHLDVYKRQIYIKYK